MKGTPNDHNTVFIRGKVTGKYVTPKIARLYVSVKDYQQKPDDSGYAKRNSITITFYGDDVKKIENVNARDRVDIKGVIQSVRDPRSGKWSQECWGLEVTPTRTLIEMATQGEFKGDIFPEDENIVTIRGKVAAVYPHTENWVEVMIKTNLTDPATGKAHISNSRLTWYVRDSVRVTSLLQREGTEVIAVGKIESIERQRNNGKKYRFESVTVRDLKILNPPKRDYTDTLMNSVIKEVTKESQERQSAPPIPETDEDGLPLPE